MTRLEFSCQCLVIDVAKETDTRSQTQALSQHLQFSLQFALANNMQVHGFGLR